MAKNYYYNGTGSGIRRGSSGQTVKDWQTYLAEQGYYQGPINGDFGSVTDEATKAYQRDKGLAESGLVDKDTYSAAGFIDQDILNGPNWGNQGAYDQVISNYVNRDAFSFDVNADALYNQYKDIYNYQSRLATQDAIGQASAMTGGYGNTYAATVGAQVGQQYAKALSDTVPELYQLALDKYTADGEKMLNDIDVLTQDYAKYMTDWQTDYAIESSKIQPEIVETPEPDPWEDAPWENYDEEKHVRYVEANGDNIFEEILGEISDGLETGELDVSSATSAVKEMLYNSQISPSQYRQLIDYIKDGERT
jgi:peptidoglycan hydrolase-like protein with peptidoglycan-binding domain